MILELYILDLIGTFAFAAYGAYFALGKHFDIFGVFCSAFLFGQQRAVATQLTQNAIHAAFVPDERKAEMFEALRSYCDDFSTKPTVVSVPSHLKS